MAGLPESIVFGRVENIGMFVIKKYESGKSIRKDIEQISEEVGRAR